MGKQIKFAQPLITEEDKQAVLAVLGQGRLTDGPQVRAFEEEFAAFCEIPYAIAVSSCWSALYLSYRALGIGPGDLVICPALTHVATAHAIVQAGATPVFVDCRGQIGNDREGEADICRRSVFLCLPTVAAICTLHYVGNPSGIRLDTSYIFPDEGIISSHNEVWSYKVIDKPLVADCALALGTRFQGKSITHYATVSCFSFYPAKHIACGEGGMVVCHDERLAREIRKLRVFGYDHARGYDVTALGGNFRMTEMQAALGRGQLRRMPENLAWRNERFQQLSVFIESGGLGTVVKEASDAESAYYCCVVILPEGIRARRDQIQQQLLAAGIETSVYYPKIVPMLSFYSAADTLGQFPNAELISNGSIAFPVAPHVNEADVVYMAEQLARTIEEGV